MGEYGNGVYPIERGVGVIQRRSGPIRRSGHSGMRDLHILHGTAVHITSVERKVRVEPGEMQKEAPDPATKIQYGEPAAEIYPFRRGGGHDRHKAADTRPVIVPD